MEFKDKYNFYTNQKDNTYENEISEFNDTYILYPNAKINLNLFVREKKETWWGQIYHRILSVMVPVSLYDRMIIKPGKFNVNYRYLSSENIPLLNHPDDEQKINLEKCIIRKTLEKLDLTEDKINYEIIIEKNIPLASGLGGASSDAAFFIKFLLEKNIIAFKNKKELLKKMCEIGSDLPFFYINEPAIVGGFGEKIIPIKLSQNLFFVVFQPFNKISTQKMYEMLDEINARKIIDEKNEKKLIKIFKKNLQNNKNYVSSLSEIANNDFEQIVSKIYNEFNDWKLLLKGSFFAQMSGAGSSIYGIFLSYKEAKNCYDSLKKIHGRVKICSCKI
ncbi:MAG: hypothetical protein NUV32_02830 [Exilispira sp.]|jgi:4-diphosphocytidyl-2-C-methyl-D-erythritol kinase|nr:hypothetical protein [Exilispira sp.]